MFAPRYFATRYFTPRYFPPGVEVATEEEPINYYGSGGKRFVSKEFIEKLWELQELRETKRKSAKQTELPLEVTVGESVALPTPDKAAKKVRQRGPAPGHFKVNIEAMIARQRMSLTDRAAEHAAKLAARREVERLEAEELEQVMLMAAMIAEDD